MWGLAIGCLRLNNKVFNVWIMEMKKTEFCCADRQQNSVLFFILVNAFNSRVRKLLTSSRRFSSVLSYPAARRRWRLSFFRVFLPRQCQPVSSNARRICRTWSRDARQIRVPTGPWALRRFLRPFCAAFPGFQASDTGAAYCR